jgi:hypothetical protein
MTRLVLLLALVLHAVAGTAGGDRVPRVDVDPGVVRLGQQATIAVTAVRARSLEVRLPGATDIAGRQLPWQRLRHVGGRWVGVLPAPALRGVYPIELRTGHRAAAFRPRGAFLRTFARDTRARPAFGMPADAARWWVRAMIGAELVAVKAWSRPAFDRRELRLHRLFVVAYSPPGKPAARDRRGLFIEVFRDGYAAHWRVLETSVAP